MTALTAIGGVGPKRAEMIEKLGISSVEELIEYFPKRYIDYAAPRTFASVKDKEHVLVCGRICKPLSVKYVNGKTISSLTIQDEIGYKITVSWFYKVYAGRNDFRLNDEYTFCGVAKKRNGFLSLNNPEYEKGRPQKLIGIKPVYRLNAYLSQNTIRSAVKNALGLGIVTEDGLPSGIAEKYGLMNKDEMIRQMHFPTDKTCLINALRRKEFEETFMYKAAVGYIVRERRNIAGHSFVRKDAEIARKTAELGFELTGAQRRTLDEILNDMAKPVAMNRIVQGDVGCGKTVVALLAMYNAALNGEQAMLVAPTEILARQHYDNACRLLCDAEVCLLTGSMKQAEKKENEAKIASGKAQIIIGTHAVLSEKVRFARLGLAIIDEQHRFGVRQRSMAAEKGDNPDMLIMSATPIPRTLRLSLFGELDISIIDELPAGRKKVRTNIVPQEKIKDMYPFMVEQVRAGGQGYIICPMIEDDEDTQIHSVTQVYDRLSKNELSEVRVGLLHSELSEEEKQRVIDGFTRGEIDVLISTIVVEVGVNVPDATFMTVFDAERFGLAQLHQLRGRVGRGNKESFCFLTYDGENEETVEKLRTLCRTNDGFEIAQKDMEMRRSGELLGFRQSGIPSAEAMHLSYDPIIQEETSRAVRQIFEEEEYSEQRKEVVRSILDKYGQRLDEIILN